MEDTRTIVHFHDSDMVYELDTKKFSSEYKFKFVTTKKLLSEDWKTSVASGCPTIPADTEITITGIVDNLYGRYITTRYNGQHFYLNPRDIKVVPR